MVSHHPGKSGGLKNCYRGDKTFTGCCERFQMLLPYFNIIVYL